MKRLLWSAACGLGMLLLGSGPAAAETFSLDALPVGTGATGSYGVTATRASTALPFTVTVTSSSALTNQDVIQLNLSFFTARCDDGSLVNATAGAGSTAGGGDATANGAWNFSPGPSALFSSPVGTSIRVTKAPGSNLFTGSVTLASNALIKNFKVDLTGDGSVTWQACTLEPLDGDLTPEPGALALLLPGLLPMGLALKRLRRK